MYKLCMNVSIKKINNILPDIHKWLYLCIVIPFFNCLYIYISFWYIYYGSYIYCKSSNDHNRYFMAGFRMKHPFQQYFSHIKMIEWLWKAESNETVYTVQRIFHQLNSNPVLQTQLLTLLQVVEAISK